MQPNIILINCDDLGYGDCQQHGERDPAHGHERRPQLAAIRFGPREVVPAVLEDGHGFGLSDAVSTLRPGVPAGPAVRRSLIAPR